MKFPIFGSALVLAASVFMVTAMPTADAQTPDWAATQKSFLTENAKKAGWKATTSGLQYTVLKPGDGKTPKIGRAHV